MRTPRRARLPRANWLLRIGAACILAIQSPSLLPVVELETLLERSAFHRNLSPGVSLRVSSHPLGVEYDWLVAPRAKPETIRMRFPGASLRLGVAGELIIQRTGRFIRHTKPHAFQTIRGRKVPVMAEFALLADGEAGFRIGPYDPEHELVIDPVVLYSSSLGGSGGEEMAGIAMDAQGFVYVAGTVGSTDFPTTEGAFQRERKGTSDLYVAKIDRDGKRLVFSTLIGGSAAEFANAIAVDASGNIYIAGQTYSRDYPGLRDGFQDGLWRSVITKIGRNGESVNSLFGFPGGEIHAMTTDAAGSIYFGGMPGNIPITPGTFQSPNGDAFVAKLLPSGQLAYASVIGGARLDDVLGIAVDKQGNAYLAGVTDSPDFPTTPGAFLERNPGYCVSCWRGFVTKVNPTGTALVYSTYLGGTDLEGFDDARGIGVDDAGNAYVTGRTRTIDFPSTPDALLPSLNSTSSRGPRAAFVSKLDPSGSRLLYSTFLHGGRMWDDEGVFLAVSRGKVYVAGNSATLRFPELNPVQPGRGDERANGVVIRCGDLSIPLRYCWDLFLTVFNAADMTLQFSTHLGSRRDDVVRGLAVNAEGEVAVGGRSTGYPAPAVPLPGSTSWQHFVTKIGLEGKAPLIRYDWWSSAAFAPAGITGGLMVTIFGKNITAREGIVAASSVPLPTELDGVSVEVGGRAAPLYAVANIDGVEQTNFQLPWRLPTVPLGPAGFEYVYTVVNNNGMRSLPLLHRVSSGIGPALFAQGNGDALTVHLSDGALVTKDNPARHDEVIIFYGTGFGPVEPPVRDGGASPADPPSRVVTLPAIVFGGLQDSPRGEVLFCGLTPGLVGLYQVNARVPRDSPSGKVAVYLRYETEGSLSGSSPRSIEIE